MVFTVLQTTLFLKNSDQMGLYHYTCLHLQNEGIATQGDLIDLTKESAWSPIIKNCKRPARIPNPVNPDLLIAEEAFQFPAKLLIHLRVVAQAAEYYISHCCFNDVGPALEEFTD